MAKQYTHIQEYGNSILVRGFDTTTYNRFQERVKFKPTLYVKSNKPTKIRSLLGDPVSPVEFGSIKEAKEYAESLSDVSNGEIYGQRNFVQQFAAETFLGDIVADLQQISAIVIDIETAIDGGKFPDPHLADEEVLLITTLDRRNGKVTTFGSKHDFLPSNDSVTKKAKYYKYIKCKDEIDLLKRFIVYVNQVNCDVITGWNSNQFDMLYLFNRIVRVLGDDMVKFLSPWKRAYIREKFDKVTGNTVQQVALPGISLLDGLELYKKFTQGSRESYSLSYISEYEQVEVIKHDYSDLKGGFRELYNDHWDRFVEYNIADVLACNAIIDKQSLLDIVYMVSYDAKQNFEDALSPVRTWENLIYHYCEQNDMVLDPRRQRQFRPYEGAYVMEPVPGRYGWGASLDATALYPSIMLFLNISPETIAGKIPGVDVTGCLSRRDYPIQANDSRAMAANGLLMKTGKDGIVQTLIKRVMGGRRTAKNKMLQLKDERQKLYKSGVKDTTSLDIQISRLEAVQKSKKTLLNSLYGGLANKYFLYFNVDMAEAITMTGQFIIRSVGQGVEHYINDSLNQNERILTGGDTDSVYIDLSSVVKRVIGMHDTAATEVALRGYVNTTLQPQLDKIMNSVGSYLNMHSPGAVGFKLEKIYDSAVWVAKKRYALHVLSSEGVVYAEPQVEITGLEIVRSSTPKVVKDSLKNCVQNILTGNVDALNAEIEKVRKLFDKSPPEVIAFPRGVSDVQKYTAEKGWKPHTPIAVRGAILYNRLIRQFNLKEKPEIKDGAKIKFLYLNMPNPIMEDVIAFDGTLPNEFGLHNYIARDTQFEKAFLVPLESIANAAMVRITHGNSLEQFYG